MRFVRARDSLPVTWLSQHGLCQLYRERITV